MKWTKYNYGYDDSKLIIKMSPCGKCRSKNVDIMKLMHGGYFNVLGVCMDCDNYSSPVGYGNHMNNSIDGIWNRII